jgi:hypothetical protein
VATALQGWDAGRKGAGCALESVSPNAENITNRFIRSAYIQVSLRVET